MFNNCCSLSFLLGYGIFAKKNFEVNDFIVEYASEYISKSEALKREETYERNGDGSYLFFLGSHGYDFFFILIQP